VTADERELEEAVAAAVAKIPGIPRAYPAWHGRSLIAALRESGYVIVAANHQQETRAKVAADLRRAADGRREYARTAVKDADEQDREEDAARAYESAAGIAEDPIGVLDLIPVHWWTAEERAAVGAGELTARNVRPSA
jgi:hypothetical protein